MELIPFGRSLATQMETLLQGGQGASLGLLISIVIPDHPFEFVAQQSADGSEFASGQKLRLPDHVLIQAEGDILFRHVPVPSDY
jgi:hypothetical protein